MLPFIAMRIRELLIVGAMALPIFAACKKSGGAADAGPEAAPSASASDTASAPVQDAAPEAAPAVHRVSVPAVGNGCHPGADSVACAPDKLTELTCQGGIWRALQTCRGTGGCSGVGSALNCVVGQPIVGDPCVVGQAPSKCATPQEVQSCVGGTYRDQVCTPPQKCKPLGNGQFACR
jgi:hypothetical protein